MHAGGGAQLSGGCVGLQQQKQQHAQSIRCTSMCELAAAAAAGALSATRARPFVPGLSKCVARAGHEPPACHQGRGTMAGRLTHPNIKCTARAPVELSLNLNLAASQQATSKLVGAQQSSWAGKCTSQHLF